jgi:hypothetical protein
MSQDHMSTLSRPRSTTEAYVSNGSIANGRPTSMPNGNGNGIISNGNGHCNGATTTIGGLVTRTAGGLHEDLEFPQVPRTLSRKKGLVWMRPHVSDLLKNYHNYVDKDTH